MELRDIRFTSLGIFDDGTCQAVGISLLTNQVTRCGQPGTHRHFEVKGEGQMMNTMLTCPGHALTEEEIEGRKINVRVELV